MDEKELYELILSKELTWEGLLRDIVKQEDIDPWDIDINFLADKYRVAIKNIDNIDFRLCGKFLLAAAILLKMKSDKFDIKEFNLEPEEYFADFVNDFDIEFFAEEMEEQELRHRFERSGVEVDLRVPRTRRRPVSIDELVGALRNAMDVKKRREERREQLKQSLKFQAKVEPVDIGNKIKNLYEKIVDFFQNLQREEVSFSELVPSHEKMDIIWTFVPLLHLNNDGKVSIHQEVQFGEIKVKKPE